MNFKSWIQQPSTISGLGKIGALLSATVAGVVAHAISHDTTTTAYAVAGGATLAGAVVQLVMPDKTAAPSSVEKLITDTATAVVQHNLNTALPGLVRDAMAAFSAITGPAALPAPVAPGPVVAAEPAIPAPADPVAA